MAQLIPVAMTAISAFQTVSSIASVFDDSAQKQGQQAVEQLQQQQRLEQRVAANNAALEKQEIQVKAAEVEAQKRQALKRAVASRRASFGASGVSSGDGSSEAVLLGLFEESESEKQKRDQLNQIKLQTIDQDLLNQKRVNTLRRTQLEESNRFKNSRSIFDTASDIAKIF